MKVAGYTNKKIAQAIGDVSPQQVTDALQRIPNLYEQLSVYRENLKLRKIKWLFDAEQKLWGRIDEEIPTGTAKDIDALMRAAHAAEKIGASVAGEAQRVDVKTDQAPNVDLKALFLMLGPDGLKDLA